MNNFNNYCILFFKIILIISLLIIIYLIIKNIFFKLKQKYIYLFCYGSNSVHQIKERLNIYSEIEYFPGFINNYCRIFAGFSKKWNGGVASISFSKKNKVYGIIIKINETDLKKLDMFEKGYIRKIMNVYSEYHNNYLCCNVYIKYNEKYFDYPSVKYIEAINKMLNDRYYDSPNNLSRKIIIKIKQDDKIINIGNWTNKDGLILYSKQEL